MDLSDFGFASAEIVSDLPSEVIACGPNVPEEKSSRRCPSAASRAPARVVVPGGGQSSPFRDATVGAFSKPHGHCRGRRCCCCDETGQSSTDQPQRRPNGMLGAPISVAQVASRHPPRVVRDRSDVRTEIQLAMSVSEYRDRLCYFYNTSSLQNRKRGPPWQLAGSMTSVGTSGTPGDRSCAVLPSPS